MTRPKILYVTDLAYEAQGRVYRDEDLYLSARLGEHFDIALCNQPSAESLMAGFDAVVVRNSGPAMRHQAAYDSFRDAAIRRHTVVFNQLVGRADMGGKQYLLDLAGEGFAVVPSIDTRAEIHRLPAAAAYIVKPKLGSDSIGMSTVTADQLAGLELDGTMLVQPRIEFGYEVSFYFVDHEFQYALYARDPEQRWELQPYDASSADVAFAQHFIAWNRIARGIQRVDACRTASGDLLLMELEDHNPYLSLDVIDAPLRDRFVDTMRDSILELIAGR